MAQTNVAPLLERVRLDRTWNRPVLSTGRRLGMVAALDLLSAGAAGLAVSWLGLGLSISSAQTADRWLLILLPGAWLAVLALAGGYDRRVLAAGPEHFRRCLTAGLWLGGSVAAVAFLGRLELSRALVAVMVCATVALSLTQRYAGRRLLHRQLAAGRSMHRVMVVGTNDEAADLVGHIRRAPWTGFHVVGMRTFEPTATRGGWSGVDIDDLVHTVRTAGATAVAVAGSRAVASSDLRALSWALQGSGIDLVVAPAMTDVAGPRVSVRLVEGLPLLHVEEPELAGARRAVKGALDRVGACLFGLFLAPLLLGIALAIKVTSPGPVFFRQQRVGIGGRTFSMLKFRSMRAGAEDECAGLLHLNVHDGPLFKIRNDPRVTAVGRWLRRHSLDELPQLWNVVRGSMSLVGPRPPLPSEVERYGVEAMRRLLVKPGMTGLWQVNGRSELPWEETVRLDLFYVENWSVGLDLMVLAKTLPAVLRCRGAY